MEIQLPAEAAATAGVILTFSFLCLGTAGILIWLVWVQNERTSCKYQAFRRQHILR